jgi:hypothetical protein
MESDSRAIEADQERRMEDVHIPVFQRAGFQKNDHRLVVGEHRLQLGDIRRTKVNLEGRSGETHQVPSTGSSRLGIVACSLAMRRRSTNMQMYEEGSEDEEQQNDRDGQPSFSAERVSGGNATGNRSRFNEHEQAEKCSLPAHGVLWPKNDEREWHNEAKDGTPQASLSKT